MVKRSRFLLVAFSAISLLWPGLTSAQIMTSTSYSIDTNTSSNFGGAGSSTDYALTDTGGQSAAATGGSQSYMLGTGYISDLPKSIELSVLPSGTYAYWPFDTGSGDMAYDMSTNSDNGNLIGSPAWAPTGEVGQAIAFNGSTQYMATSDDLTAPNTYTAEFWFKSTSASGGELMGFGNNQTGASSTLDRVVYLTDTGNIEYGVDPSGTDQVIGTSSGGYNTGAWHFVAVALSAAGMRLYVDGSLAASNASVTSGGSYSGYWRMGYDNLTGWPNAPLSNYAAATLDEARLYTRALTAAEVTNDYTAGQNGLTSAFTLPNISPGTSQNYSLSAVVRTDAPSYDLYMQAPSPLTRDGGGATFPSIAGTIAAPAAWTEGTTTGLGFTLTGGYQIESKWGTSPNYDYAQIPTAATVYHLRPSSQSTPPDGAPETTTIQYRADASSTQYSGTYSTQVIYTATMVP